MTERPDHLYTREAAVTWLYRLDDAHYVAADGRGGVRGDLNQPTRGCVCLGGRICAWRKRDGVAETRRFDCTATAVQWAEGQDVGPCDCERARLGDGGTPSWVIPEGLNPLGVALTWALAVTLTIAGIVVAFTTAPMSGGHLIGASLLTGIGAGLIARLWWVALK